MSDLVKKTTPSHEEATPKAPAAPSKWCWCGILTMVPHEHAGFARPLDKCWCGILLSTPHEHAGYPPGKV